MRTAVAFSVLSIFQLLGFACAGDNGIIGFGLTLYQDQCGQACYDSLSMLYLSCTTFDDSMDMDMSSDMGMMGTTSEDCYASNTPWLQTMAYCIKSNCAKDGYSEEKMAKSFSTQAVAGASTPTYQESLPATAPTVELAVDAVWLNETSLVNSETYFDTYGTEAEFARSEYIHTRYAVILYLITIGIIIGCGVLAHARSAFPSLQKSLQSSPIWAKLQQYIFLPALFGKRRHEPLPGNLGYVPSRALSIFIAIYVVMNVIMSSVSFRHFWPSTFWSSKQYEMCEYVGNRTGTLSLVNMSIAILFAGRNNVLLAVTGWNQTAFLTFHRWAARVATLQVVVHSIVYTLAFFEPNGTTTYAEEVKLPFYWWGIIGTIAMCLATAFAVLPIRIRAYDLFLPLHIALVILVLIGSWYHLVPHFGFIYGYQVWLYIAFAYWSYDRVARFVRLIWYNGFNGTSAVVEAVPNCDIMHVTVFPRAGWKFGPGQHSFLYVPWLGYNFPKFWESHPFSIAGWTTEGELQPNYPSSTDIEADEDQKKGAGDVSTNVTDIESCCAQPKPAVPTSRPQSVNPSQLQGRTSIQFLVRVHAGMTSTLQQRLFSTRSRSARDISVYTEGPYAGHRATLQPLALADTIVCVIGGIGITNALGFVQEYTSQSRRVMRKATRFILAWSAKEAALIEYAKLNFLAKHNGHNGFMYTTWCTDSSYVGEKQNPEEKTSSIGGRMNIENVIRAAVEPGCQTTVLVCGPSTMADEATRQIVNCVRDGFRVDLVEEAYAW